MSDKIEVDRGTLEQAGVALKTLLVLYVEGYSAKSAETVGFSAAYASGGPLKLGKVAETRARRAMIALRKVLGEKPNAGK